MTTTASLGRDKQRRGGGSKVVDNARRRRKHLQREALETRTSYNNTKVQEQAPTFSAQPQKLLVQVVGLIRFR